MAGILLESVLFCPEDFFIVVELSVDTALTNLFLYFIQVGKIYQATIVRILSWCSRNIR
jgi:hypothetical protein